MKSNFQFLQKRWEILSDLGKLAEKNLYSDPNTTMIKLRMFTEQIVDYIFAYDKLEKPEEDTLFNKLKLLEREDLLNDEIKDIFHTLRQEGNKAVHESYNSLKGAKTLLSLSYKAAVWFMQVYGDWDFEPEEFKLPSEDNKDEKLNKLQNKYEEMINEVQEEIAVIKEKQKKLTDITKRREKSRESSARLSFTEAENKIIEHLHDNDKKDTRKIKSEYKFITTENIDEKENKAGKKVWDTVRKSYSGRNCIAYWRYPIFSRLGENRKEPDIVIADKKQGIIVIEVMEYIIDEIEDVSYDKWEFKDDENLESPYYLVEDQLYAIKGLYESERSLRKIKGKSAVVLPNIKSSEWENKGFLRENLIFADELGQKTFFKKIDELEAIFGRHKMNNKQWKDLLMVLTGQNTYREENRDKDKDRQTRSGVKALIKEDLFEVDMQQEVIGKTIPPGPQRIRGIAGSGKTVLLAQKAAHMHLKHPEWKIALVFFTRSLYDSTIREVDKWLKRFSNGEVRYDPKTNDNLLVLHAWGAKEQAGFYTTLCQKHKIRSLNAGSSQLGEGDPNEKLVKACKLLLESVDEIKPIFDAVLIDEAQDLIVDAEDLKYEDKQPFYWLAYKSLKEVDDSGNRRLIWAYDEAQSLNSLNIPSAPQLFGDDPQFKRMVSGFHEGGIRKSEIMNKCYRTPGPVLTAAHAIGMGLLREGGMLRGYTTQEDWENIGYKVIEGSFNPVGQKVILHRPPEMTPNRVPQLWNGDIINFNTHDNRDKELKVLARKIKYNIEEDGLNPARDILVIALGNMKEAYRLKVKAARAIKNEGIDIYIPKALKNNVYYPKYPDTDPDKFWNEGGVTVCTTYRAKGNEAYMVYVIGLDKVAEDEANFTLRNQLFVALTRTKGWLEVSGIGNYNFYREFNKVLESGNKFEFIFQRPQLEK
ncbi:MAG: ATP-binding domain-containing protein [Halanaerobiales bacterium]